MDPPVPAFRPVGLNQHCGTQVFGGRPRLRLSERATVGQVLSTKTHAVLVPIALLTSARHFGRHKRRVSMHAGNSAGQRVVVTGMGVVSPFGTDKEDFYENLLDGKSAIKRITKFDPEVGWSEEPCITSLVTKNYQQHV
eukprot:s326_g1.t1